MEIVETEEEFKTRQKHTQMFELILQEVEKKALKELRMAKGKFEYHLKELDSPIKRCHARLCTDTAGNLLLMIDNYTILKIDLEGKLIRTRKGASYTGMPHDYAGRIEIGQPDPLSFAKVDSEEGT